MPAPSEAVKELPWLPGSDSIWQEVLMANKARYLEADRAQLRWDSVDLDSQLASEHRARVVWAFVEQLDLSDLYAGIRAVEGEPGRPPPDRGLRRRRSAS